MKRYPVQREILLLAVVLIGSLSLGAEVYYYRDTVDGSAHQGFLDSALFWDQTLPPINYDPGWNIPGAHLLVVPLSYWQHRTEQRVPGVVVGSRSLVLLSRPKEMALSALTSLGHWLAGKDSLLYQEITLRPGDDDLPRGAGPWSWEELYPGMVRWLDLSSGKTGRLGIKLTQKMPVLGVSRDHRPQEEIDPQVLEIQWVDASRGTTYVALDEWDDQQRWMTRTTLRKGTPLRRAHLAPVPQVQPGQALTLRRIRDNLTVEIPVKALNEGCGGDLVRVITPGGKTYRGTLTPGEPVVLWDCQEARR